MNLGLGTAQFGLDYGATNADGQCTEETVAEIIAAAADYGMLDLDCAQAYGASEAVLGRVLPNHHSFRINSKLDISELSDAKDPTATLRALVEGSLKRLKVDCLDGLLAHHSAPLLSPKGADFWDALEALKAAGIVRRIGVSVYDVSELEALLDRYPIDLVQLPLNVFDQRFQTSGVIDMLTGRGIGVHVRSVFLQGVLLAHPGNLPGYFTALEVPLKRFHTALSRSGASALTGALAFVRHQDGIEAVIIGVTSLAELTQAHRAWEAAEHLDLNWECFAETNEILDPRDWPAREALQSGAT